jgi:predicted Ser/Thr protein kinase
VADPVDRFMNQIQGIEKRLLNDLKMIAKRMDKLSDTELVAIAKELDFFQELLDRGYTNAVNGLMEAYEGQVEEVAKEAARRGIKTVRGATVEQLQLLQDLEAESLLGKATTYD